MLVDCPLVLDDLMATSEEEIEARSSSSYLTLVLWSLRSRGQVPQERLGAWARHLARLHRERGSSPIEGILSYHLAVSSEDPPPVVRTAIAVHPDLEKTYMSMAEKLEQRGIEKGRETGRTEGFDLGLAATLAKLVTLRFGPPSPEVAARIASLDRAGLDRALDRILSATSIEALFDPR